MTYCSYACQHSALLVTSTEAAAGKSILPGNGGPPTAVTAGGSGTGGLAAAGGAGGQPGGTGAGGIPGIGIIGTTLVMQYNSNQLDLLYHNYLLPHTYLEPLLEFYTECCTTRYMLFSKTKN